MVQFIFVCVACLLISTAYPFIPLVKKKVVKKLSGKKKEYTAATKLFMVLLYFFDTSLSYAIMLLIMTMNGYLMMVCLAGLTLGYGFTAMKKDFSTTLKESRRASTKNKKTKRNKI